MIAAGGLHQRRQRPVVHVAHPREEVVDHLEVEPAQVPAEQRVAAGEVDGGGDLVRGPVGGEDRAGGRDEGGLADGVGELEDGGERHPERADGEQPDREEPPGRVEDDGEHHGPADEDRLAEEEPGQVPAARALEGLAADPADGEVAEVVEEEPAQREDDVEQPHVEVLPAVAGSARLARRDPEQRARVQVGVDANHVGVGVVQHVVLLAPQRPGGADQVGREGQHPVPGGVRRRAAVVGVVHHVEAEPRPGQPQRDGQQGRLSAGRVAEDQQAIGGREPGDDDHRLEAEPPAAARRPAGLTEVGRDPRLDVGVEGAGWLEGDPDLVGRHGGSGAAALPGVGLGSTVLEGSLRRAGHRGVTEGGRGRLRARSTASRTWQPSR